MKGDGRSILLVDDHAVVREGYRAVLQKQPGLRVVAEAADGAEAYRLFKELQPDLVIMDLTMPGIGGIEAIRRIRTDSDARILVFTMHQNAAFAVQAIRAGARGYVTKTSPPETLVRAAMDILAGRTAISPDIDHELALSHVAGERVAADVLSAREFEVLRMLLAERTTEQIADTLHLSPKTVANLRSLMKDKLGVASDIELVRLALRQGILHRWMQADFDPRRWETATVGNRLPRGCCARSDPEPTPSIPSDFLTGDGVNLRSVSGCPHSRQKRAEFKNYMDNRKAGLDKNTHEHRHHQAQVGLRCPVVRRGSAGRKRGRCRVRHHAGQGAGGTRSLRGRGDQARQHGAVGAHGDSAAGRWRG